MRDTRRRFELEACILHPVKKLAAFRLASLCSQRVPRRAVFKEKLLFVRCACPQYFEEIELSQNGMDNALCENLYRSYLKSSRRLVDRHTNPL